MSNPIGYGHCNTRKENTIEHKRMTQSPHLPLQIRTIIEAQVHSEIPNQKEHAHMRRQKLRMQIELHKDHI
jgi:hypothetical protein